MQAEIAWADAVQPGTGERKKVVVLGLTEANDEEGMLTTQRMLDLADAQALGKRLTEDAEAAGEEEGVQVVLEVGVGELTVQAEVAVEHAKALGEQLQTEPSDIQVASPAQMPPEPQPKGNGGSGLILP